VTKRDRIVLTVVACVALVAAFWLLALGPKRKEASELSAKVTVAEQQLATAQQSVTASRGARAQYAADYATVARLGKAVPVDDDVPALIYELNATANATGVNFQSVKLAASAAAPAATPPAAAAQPQGNGSSGSGTSGASGAAAPTPSPAPATQAASATLPPGAAVGPAGFPTMPFTFTFAGSFFDLADFFQQIQGYIKPGGAGVDVQGRLLMINSVSLAAAPGGFPRMLATVSANAYLLPASQGLTNGASPSAPSSQPVAAAGASATPSTAPATVAPGAGP